MGDGNFKWYAASGSDPESYHIVEDTREAAIQAARNDEFEDFTIVEADKSLMSPNVDGDWYAERIMEDLGERNEECFGEDGPDDPWSGDGTAAADLSKAIEATVAEWLKAHPGRTWSFGSTRNEEYFPAEATTEAAAE